MKKPRSLPDVIREVADLLLANDYGRYQSDAGAFYYVFGENARSGEMEGESFHNYTAVHHEASDVDDWQAMTVLAAPTPAYVQRLRANGVGEDFCQALEEALAAAEPKGAFGAVITEWVRRLAATGRLDELAKAVDAGVAALGASGKAALPESDRAALRRAFERRFLRELAQRYPQIVDRAVGLDRLTVADPQLQEATRCFLYGFFRATIMVAASAVESHLKRMLGVPPGRSTKRHELVAGVYGPEGLNPDNAMYRALGDMFEERNDVAHAEGEPRREHALKILDFARGTVEKLSGKQAVG